MSDQQVIAVGLDMSLTATGVCVLSSTDVLVVGTVKTKPADYVTIYERIDWIVNQCCTTIVNTISPPAFGRVDVSLMPRIFVCVETTFVPFPKEEENNTGKKGRNKFPISIANLKNSIALGHMIRRELTAREIPWWDVAPSQLKKFVTGSGRESKDQVTKWVLKRWGIDTKDNNQADATVLAYIARALAGGDEVSALPKYQQEVIQKIMGGK